MIIIIVWDLLACILACIIIQWIISSSKRATISLAIYRLKLAAYEIIKHKKAPYDVKCDLTKEEKDQLARDLLEGPNTGA